ncbi:UBX domain-containing protein 1 [Pleurostoma richardsiae]|uniref:UBX domain-containing protein 1 n=1 Tax=Pleurostoma richardsiae TaxID=41990 RepID=A0AA38VSI1_9PEZI|nr:UBX domain-containing protein 1 [Pleurostoma richardsiae]
MANEDDQISSFCELTGSTPEQATEYLQSSNWNTSAAVTAFFADQEEQAEEPEVGTEYNGPRTLDGRPAPQSALASSSSSKKPTKKKGLATLSSLGGGHDSHDDDDDDEDDFDESKGPRDLFAGGEKSGLAVQDPAQGPSGTQKVIKDILAKARANAQRPDSDPAAPGPSQSSHSHFRGTGMTLGGDGVASRSIPDPLGNPIPRQQPTRNEPPQERVLHLWHDGFSIDDGELKRFDDPDNATDLQMIRQGRAPLHLMNVRYDQPVDVKLEQHDEHWRQLPKVYKPFGGEGRRLGSPVPGESHIAPPPPASSSTATASTSSTITQPTSLNVDDSQPTVMIRIQLPDGTRLPARFNTTNTIDDVYHFVQRASIETRSRPWVLATTFPNKDHTDRTLVLSEIPEFKKGGTAVVKWL